MVSPHHAPQDDSRYSEVLAHSRRRHVLRVLSTAADPMAIADLAAEIAAREQPVSDGDPNWDLIERIYITLYHVHIPKLDDHGLVDFSMARRTATLTESLPTGLRTELQTYTPETPEQRSPTRQQAPTEHHT